MMGPQPLGLKNRKVRCKNPFKTYGVRPLDKLFRNENLDVSEWKQKQIGPINFLGR